MNKLMEFTTEDGAVVVVEATDSAGGTRLVSRDGGGPAAQAVRTFEAALDGVRAATLSALRVFRDGSLRPDSVELEFGVKLTAEAGAIIAKGAGEGQLVVRLAWTSERSAPDAGAVVDEGAGAGAGASANTSSAPGTLPGPATPLAEPAPRS
ncbi:CU044_2847 family protein [Streptomyces sp. NPDC047085]|uniref:CU044_2847 family protein n=1 Tax=Streptomyces sp. NPDC047085 TaxID=3155140 RepID=UPI00340B7326